MTGFSVTPLGTVSPYPKGTCNCPGFLVQSGDKKVLLDCESGISRLLHFPEIDKKLYLEEAKQNFENVTLAKEGKKLILRR